MANSAQDNKAFTTMQATKAATFACSLAEQAKLLAAEEHRRASSVTVLKDVKFPDLKPENQCKYCSLPFTDQGSDRFRLRANREELAELGLGFPLFFWL